MAFNPALDRALSGVVDTVINLDLFAYRASIVSQSTSTAADGGQVPGTVTTVASDLPLKFKDLKSPMTKVVGDKTTIVATHLLTFRADQYTEAINERQEIHVAALGDEAARVFVRPFRIKGSFHHLVKIAAVLKSQ